MQKDDQNPISTSPPSLSNEEIAEALRTMGETCICPPIMGTALFHSGELTVDCPIHGEKAHHSGIDISRWQRPVNPGDTITVMAESAANKVDINIMSEKFKGTILYGTEEAPPNIADEYDDWEDANPPRQSKSAPAKHTEDGRSVFTSLREIGKRARKVIRRA